MKDLLIPIDRAGRIVLPKEVREELAIKPGDTFKLALRGSSVTLTPTKEESRLVRKGKALVFSTAGDETLNPDEVEQILQEERAERDSRSTRGIIGRRQPA